MEEASYGFDRCKICDGAIQTLKEKTYDGLIIARCKDCGLKFVKLIPAPKVNEKETNWYFCNYSQVPQKFYYGLDKIMSYLKSIGKEDSTNGLSLLDVGCGGGDFLLICKDKGFHVAGVELSKGAIKLCRKKGLHNIFMKDIDEIKAAYDIITLFDVAEHLEDPKSFFKKLYHRLNPEGIVYLETPRKSIADIYLYIFGALLGKRRGRISREHLQLYSDDSLRILLRDSGFDIVLFEPKFSLSWGTRRSVLLFSGISSGIIAACLEKLVDILVALGLLGYNKAIIIAKKREG